MQPLSTAAEAAKKEVTALENSLTTKTATELRTLTEELSKKIKPLTEQTTQAESKINELVKEKVKDATEKRNEIKQRLNEAEKFNGLMNRFLKKKVEPSDAELKKYFYGVQEATKALNASNTKMKEAIKKLEKSNDLKNDVALLDSAHEEHTKNNIALQEKNEAFNKNFQTHLRL